MLCGFPVGLIVFVLTFAAVAAVVMKVRGMLKKVLPSADPDNGFVLYLIISGAIVLSAVEVGSFVREHNDSITSFFQAARERCEPPPDNRTTEQRVDDMMKQLHRQK